MIAEGSTWGILGRSKPNPLVLRKTRIDQLESFKKKHLFRRLVADKQKKHRLGEKEVLPRTLYYNPHLEQELPMWIPSR